LDLSAEQIAARLARVRDEVGPDLTIVAATKYVSVDDMATLAEAGIDVVGENRAQDLEAKHPGVLTGIREKKELTDDLKPQVDTALSDFAKIFTA
jgi:uncharacterized pyridoxal phosphate-containing UPF0001 family protein